MADYSTIKGFTIQTIAGDPSNPGDGQVWYNSTSATVKGYGMQGTSAWASGGAINSGRKFPGSNGPLTAAWYGGGGGPSIHVKETEHYDGTSWTEVNDLNTARSGGSGAGDNTASLLIGGFIGPTASDVSDLTETYNGTSWTEVGDLNTARRRGSGQGTNTAALMMGGSINSLPGSVGDIKATESWDGTSWTEVNDLNTARLNLAASKSGTPGASVVAGGAPGPFSLLVETYNGTSWTEATEVNADKVMAGSAGVETFAMVWGGINPPFYSCEQWNGSAWTEVADIGVSQYGVGSGGSATEAWQAAGTTSPGSTFPTTSNEWATPSVTKTFTAS